jgi:hypothetical protein
MCDKGKGESSVSDMLSEPERDRRIMETRAHARTGWSLALRVEREVDPRAPLEPKHEMQI